MTHILTGPGNLSTFPQQPQELVGSQESLSLPRCAAAPSGARATFVARITS